MFTCVCVCVLACERACVRAYVYVCVCAGVHVFVCARVYLCVRTRMHEVVLVQQPEAHGGWGRCVLNVLCFKFTLSSSSSRTGPAWRVWPAASRQRVRRDGTTPAQACVLVFMTETEDRRGPHTHSHTQTLTHRPWSVWPACRPNRACITYVFIWLLSYLYFLDEIMIYINISWLYLNTLCLSYRGITMDVLS